MSSLRNAVQRRHHRERDQPVERIKWGLLEKHKDYSLRARDYNEKKRRLQILRHKVAERHPYEFHFGMSSSMRHDKGPKITCREGTALSQSAVSLLKTQDAGYLRTVIQKTRREREKLEQDHILQGGAGSNMFSDKPSQNDKQPSTFRVAAQQELDLQVFSKMKKFVPSQSVDHIGDVHSEPWEPNFKLRQEQFQPHQTYYSSSGLASREDELGLKKDRILLKQHKRKQDVRFSRLRILKLRERDLLAAAQELEIQRAKMSHDVGGVTKAGIKWKAHPRKK